MKYLSFNYFYVTIFCAELLTLQFYYSTDTNTMRQKQILDKNLCQVYTLKYRNDEHLIQQHFCALPSKFFLSHFTFSSFELYSVHGFSSLEYKKLLDASRRMKLENLSVIHLENWTKSILKMLFIFLQGFYCQVWNSIICYWHLNAPYIYSCNVLIQFCFLNWT